MIYFFFFETGLLRKLMLRRHKSGKYAGQGMLCQVRALAGLVPLNSPAIGRATSIGIDGPAIVSGVDLELDSCEGRSF